MSVIASEMIRYFKSNSIGKIAIVYDDRNGMMFEVKKIGLPASFETFHVGERQFVRDNSKVTSYEKWNHWGGRCPVYRYNLEDSKPMDAEKGTDSPAKPFKMTFQRITQPSSASVNMIFRKGGAKAMLSATKNVAMDPKLVGVLCIVMGLTVGYLIATLWHPALVSGPPPGYYYKAVPIPLNTTVITK